MQGSKHAKGCAVEGRGASCDIRAGTGTLSENSDRCQKVQASPETGAANAQAFCQFTFRRQAITKLEFSLMNHLPDLINHLSGHQAISFRSDQIESA